jgi:hypothetical protein
MASTDAPGKTLINPSTPRAKSRWSYSNRAVASDGAPSANSSVPRRLSHTSPVTVRGFHAMYVMRGCDLSLYR